MPKLPDPFSPAICQRIRKIGVLYRNAVENQHDSEDGRDEAVDRINECEAAKQLEAAERAKAEHSDYVRDIARQKRIHKAALKAMLETIEKGDDAQLFPGGVDPDPSVDDLLAAADTDDDKDKADTETPADAAA